MEETSQPEFPAILVEYDGSLEVLVSNADWTDDIDHWFWCSPHVYLIDQRFNRFDPVADRSRDGRPNDIPRWRWSSAISPDFVESLIANDPHSDRNDPAFSTFLRSHPSI